MFILYPFPEALPIEKARGVQVVNMTRALADEGCEVELIQTGNDISGIYQHYGITPSPQFRPASISRSIGLAGLRLKSNKIFNFRLSRHIKSLNKKPDLIISRHLKTAYYLLRHHKDIPLLYDAHEVFCESSTNPKNIASLEKMESYVLSHASFVTAISESLREDLKLRYRFEKPVHIVRTATVVPPDMPAKDYNKPARHIVYAGSLYEWKGVDDIIKAGEYLNEACHITLIGGNETQIANLKKRLGPVVDKFSFHPFMPHERIQQYLRDACIALLPNSPGSVSRWTSPLKLFEYLANGCAIIASDIPTIRELLTEDQACFYSSGDARALAGCINKLGENPQLTGKLGRKGHALAQQHSWPHRARQIMNIISYDQTREMQ
jgi:glycosyltransferase involved in cell wall biosynthesis